MEPDSIRAITLLKASQESLVKALLLPDAVVTIQVSTSLSSSSDRFRSGINIASFRPPGVVEMLRE